MRWFILVGLILCLSPYFAQAEPIAIIVSKQSNIERVSESDIVRLYLGRSSRVSGQDVNPIDFKDDLELAQNFRQRVLKKTPLQYQQYWARLIFTGRGRPPNASIGSIEEMIEFIANNADAIGYTSKADLPANVRVLLMIE